MEIKSSTRGSAMETLRVLVTILSPKTAKKQTTVSFSVWTASALATQDTSQSVGRTIRPI